MKGRGGLPFERHRELGVELHDIRDRLLAIEIEMANAYPTTSILGAYLRKGSPRRAAHRAVDRLRDKADSQLAVDCPDQFEASVYYPNLRRD